MTKNTGGETKHKLAGTKNNRRQAKRKAAGTNDNFLALNIGQVTFFFFSADFFPLSLRAFFDLIVEAFAALALARFLTADLRPAMLRCSLILFLCQFLKYLCARSSGVPKTHSLLASGKSFDGVHSVKALSNSSIVGLRFNVLFRRCLRKSLAILINSCLRSLYCGST